MSIKIKEIAFVYHPVTDIPRARAFYEKLLGLKVGDLELEFAPGVWWIEYDVAGVALAVSNAMPAAGGVGGDGLALEVEDLDEALAAVRAAGIPLIVEPQDFAPCRMFAINSPDGHNITFHRRKA
jgi:catechol 2,3-dioxygenase-like lactoylglutathione lyase family enzyme